jgi:hypothetical protein
LKSNEFFAEKLWDFLFRRVIPLDQINEDVLTFDSTVITRYEDQQGANKGYNPKKRGRKSHHPIFAFLNKSRYVVNLWNRSGRASSGNGIVEFCNQTLERLSGKISIKMILADSGYYLAEFLDSLEEKSIDYVISAPMQQSLQHKIYQQETWRDLGDGISLAEFMFQHRSEKWKVDRRYIVIRKDLNTTGKETPGKKLTIFPEEDEKIFNYKYGLYITSSDGPAEELWRTYRLRANDENVIKENKEDFGLEGFSQNGFYATEAAMLVRIMFYNILNLFRQKMLPETESRERLQTLRPKYFITPAVLGRDGKSPVLRLGIKKQNIRQKFLYILNMITTYFDNRIAFERKGSPPET